MFTTFLHLLLLALAVAAEQGNAQDYSNSTNLICSAAEYDVGEGEVKNIPLTSSSLTPTLYVLPGDGFQGITVVAKDQDHSEEEAWFPLGEQCISTNSSWWKTYVYANLLKPSNGLRFIVKYGECSLKCHRYSTFQSLRSIQVKAHGPSHWNTTFTTSCTARNYTKEHSNSNSVCQNFPTTAPLESLSLWEKHQEWVIPVAAVVGVGLIVVALVVTWKKRHCSGEADPQPIELQSQTHKRSNNVSEPCSECQDIASAQGGPKRDPLNSIYEPFTASRNVTDTTEEGGPKRDSRNSLYQPFTAFQNVTDTTEEGGFKYESRNSLYEPLSLYQKDTAEHRV